ncbi:hypothetical protein M885DRAFT_617653 [Pelagophyceae sp. CCMP2097]|nr:hypothetical protein M885DRAFT_617653 [Pelagophyceae sp. CCMP2097]
MEAFEESPRSNEALTKILADAGNAELLALAAALHPGGSVRASVDKRVERLFTGAAHTLADALGLALEAQAKQFDHKLVLLRVELSSEWAGKLASVELKLQDQIDAQREGLRTLEFNLLGVEEDAKTRAAAAEREAAEREARAKAAADQASAEALASLEKMRAEAAEAADKAEREAADARRPRRDRQTFDGAREDTRLAMEDMADKADRAQLDRERDADRDREDAEKLRKEMDAREAARRAQDEADKLERDRLAAELGRSNADRDEAEARRRRENEDRERQRLEDAQLLADAQAKAAAVEVARAAGAGAAAARAQAAAEAARLQAAAEAAAAAEVEAAAAALAMAAAEAAARAAAAAAPAGPAYYVLVGGLSAASPGLAELERRLRRALGVEVRSDEAWDKIYAFAIYASIEDADADAADLQLTLTLEGHAAQRRAPRLARGGDDVFAADAESSRLLRDLRAPDEAGEARPDWAGVQLRLLSGDALESRAVLVTGLLPQCPDDAFAAVEDRLRSKLDGYGVSSLGKQRTERWGFTLLRVDDSKAALALVSDFHNSPVSSLYGEFADAGAKLGVYALSKADAALLTKEVRRLHAAAVSLPEQVHDVLVAGLTTQTRAPSNFGSFSAEENVMMEAALDRLGARCHDLGATPLRRPKWVVHAAGLAMLTFETLEAAWHAVDRLDGTEDELDDDATEKEVYEADDAAEAPQPVNLRRRGSVKVLRTEAGTAARVVVYERRSAVLRVEKLYPRDRPPDLEPAAEWAARKMRIRRKLKAYLLSRAALRTMSAMTSLSKVKIAEPGMSLNNRLEKLEANVAKMKRNAAGQAGGADAEMQKLQRQVDDFREAAESEREDVLLRLRGAEQAAAKADKGVRHLQGVHGEATFCDNLVDYLKTAGFGKPPPPPRAVEKAPDSAAVLLATLRQLALLGLVAEVPSETKSAAEFSLSKALHAVLHPPLTLQEVVKQETAEVVAAVEKLQVFVSDFRAKVVASLSQKVTVKDYLEDSRKRSVLADEDRSTAADRCEAVSAAVLALAREFSLEVETRVTEAFREDFARARGTAAALEGRVSAVAASVSALDAGVPLLIEEQRRREREIWDFLTRRLDRVGNFEERLQRISASLVEKPSEGQVRAMLRHLEASMRVQCGDAAALSLLVERIHGEVTRKVGRHDVQRMIEAGINAYEPRLRRLSTLAAASRSAAEKARITSDAGARPSTADARRRAEAHEAISQAVLRQTRPQSADPAVDAAERELLFTREHAALWAAQAATAAVMRLPQASIMHMGGLRQAVSLEAPLDLGGPALARRTFNVPPNQLTLAQYPNGRPGALRSIGHAPLPARKPQTHGKQHLAYPAATTGELAVDVRPGGLGPRQTSLRSSASTPGIADFGASSLDN